MAVLKAGALSTDIDLSLPRPRTRGSEEFASLRRYLLSELGVVGQLAR